MTTTPYVSSLPAPALRPDRSSSRLLLWLPVPATVATACCLLRGVDVVTSAADDLDPLYYGFAVLMILAVAVATALVSVVLGLVFSFTSAPARAGGNLAGAIWTALTGAGFAALVLWGTATDPVVRTSPTVGAGAAWIVVGALAALAPLAAVLVVRCRTPRWSRCEGRWA